jgi:uncharacterized protein Veg
MRKHLKIPVKIMYQTNNKGREIIIHTKRIMRTKYKRGNGNEKKKKKKKHWWRKNVHVRPACLIKNASEGRRKKEKKRKEIIQSGCSSMYIVQVDEKSM